MGGRRTCRVALGADSNPMCHVHDSFRCIVIVNEEKLASQKPPFLNRFEKHAVDYQDILLPSHGQVLEMLEGWVAHITRNPSSVFPGYCSSTLQSLVLSAIDRSSSEMSRDELEAALRRCQNKLAWAASESLAVLQASAPGKELESVAVQTSLSSQPCNNLMEYLLATDNEQPHVLSMVTTMTDAMETIGLAGKLYGHVNQLSTFDSEGSLKQQLDKFWEDGSLHIYVLQVDMSCDADKLALVTLLIEECWLSRASKSRHQRRACLILHGAPFANLDFRNSQLGMPWHRATIAELKCLGDISGGGGVTTTAPEPEIAQRSFDLLVSSMDAELLPKQHKCTVSGDTVAQLELAVQEKLGLAAEVKLLTWDLDFEEFIVLSELDDLSAEAKVQIERKVVPKVVQK